VDAVIDLPGWPATACASKTESFMNVMEFQIEKSSPVPAVKQIQEQIKLSIAVGALKRGDVLPPIREVEKQTGVNRGQVHNEVEDFQRLLNNYQYDRILVSPGARNEVFGEHQRNSRLLLLQMELDPAGLETARIRAGVII
jgi:DNA-binding FadR family transcriptional regulator